MTDLSVDQHPWISPRDPWLLAAFCVTSLALLVGPFYKFGLIGPPIAVLAVVSAAVLMGALRSGVIYVALVPILIPSTFYEDYLILPTGLKFAEGLYLVLIGLWALTWISGGLSRVRTPMDRAVTLFLGVVAFSCVLGFLNGHSLSQMMRDVRYPFYYSIFFLATRALPTRHARTVFSLAVAASVVVSIEYLVEFLATLNLAISGQFVRVARVEGLMLPIGMLLVSTACVFDRSLVRRIVYGLALIPIGLAFVITVGRGMWVASIAGLLALGYLVFLDRRQSRGRWVPLLVVPLLVVGVAYAFQQVTSTGVGSTAFARIGRIQNYEEDHSIAGRLMSYGVAVDKIRQKPVLGGGHGETVSYLVTRTETPHVYTGGIVDNVYLTVLLRMGIVGLAAFLYVYLRGLLLARELFRRSRRTDVRLFSAAFVTVYAALLVYGVADATLMTNRLIFMHAVFLAMVARMAAEEPA